MKDGRVLEREQRQKGSSTMAHIVYKLSKCRLQAGVNGVSSSDCGEMMVVMFTS